MTTFTFLGSEYRTNADASVIERNDCGDWVRTGSIGAYAAAKAALGGAYCAGHGVHAFGR